jgi:hypothetical protein
MKKFILEEMLLMSSTERKARKIQFNPKTTIVLGPNDTGKSCLLKSIYWTFGAEAPDIHPDWKKANIVSVIKFSVEKEKFIILRNEKFFALFDKNHNLIGTYNSVTSELGPQLSEIFDFKIKLTSQNGNEITPPPAYYFLPFYIDQDSSWNQNWSSFTKLGQIPSWRTPIIEYHTGIKTNEYYLIRTKIDQIKLLLNELNLERKFFQGTLDEIKKETDSINYDIDVNLFKIEIEEMMNELKILQEQREKYKDILVEKYNQKNNYESQINIIGNALSEVKEDYKYASIHNEIDCPTCGQIYKNSFADRFSIAQDEYKCADLLRELHLELVNLHKDIESTKENYEKNESEISHISTILSKRQGQLSLHDVIKNEGKKQVKKFLIEKINNLENDLIKKGLEQQDFNKELKVLMKRDKERKVRISNFYIDHMRSFLNDLDVKKLTQESYGKIGFKINESGSDRPRALLAYYYSILYVIREFTSSVFAPIIIDSPNQQDQDIESLKKMLEFIRDKKIEDSQLILGLTSLHNLKYDGTIITLKSKYSLLLKSEFKKIFDEINPLLEKSLLLKK